MGNPKKPLRRKDQSRKATLKSKKLALKASLEASGLEVLLGSSAPCHVQFSTFSLSLSRNIDKYVHIHI